MEKRQAYRCAPYCLLTAQIDFALPHCEVHALQADAPETDVPGIHVPEMDAAFFLDFFLEVVPVPL